jgi:hypothetical protein
MLRTATLPVDGAFGTQLSSADRTTVAALAATLSVRMPTAARIGFRHHRHHGLLNRRLAFEGRLDSHGSSGLRLRTARERGATRSHAAKRGNCTTEDEPEVTDSYCMARSAQEKSSPVSWSSASGLG